MAAYRKSRHRAGKCHVTTSLVVLIMKTNTVATRLVLTLAFAAVVSAEQPPANISFTKQPLLDVLLVADSSARSPRETGQEAGISPGWWERGADTWHYKDDWKGLKMTGRSPFTLTIRVPAGAAGGWIVLWGEGDCRLFVNDTLVDKDLDPCLIWDYDLGDCLRGLPEEVTLRIKARAACAEGEIIDRHGRSYPCATNENWTGAQGKPPRTERMTTKPSSGAFHPAHNGRLLTYNDEERGKTATAEAILLPPTRTGQALTESHPEPKG